ncbi:uncharacterized protein LOC105205694 isoform X2 [Solenopsis invicta]|uniref:uncharacterized protein LOC105205694 isoform X2 n=1 Tax=Solenopsis invicta TaxID=13686 RepID=UPI000595A390|nr:uncharacterized protein LOC105205694 isoform X2 [Solenopsis invicta]
MWFSSKAVLWANGNRISELIEFAAGVRAAGEATNSGRQCPRTAPENDGEMFQKMHRQTGHFAGQLGTEMHSDVYGSIHGFV